MTDNATLRAKILADAASFTIPEAKQYVADVLATRAADEDDRFHKLFFEEFWPLVTIAESIGDEQARMVFTGSGHGVDATLFLGLDRRSQMVELTAAIDGHQEALQDEHMKLYGSAPLTVKLTPTKNKNSKQRRIEETMADWLSADDYNNELLTRVKHVVAEKRERVTSRPHYRDAWLGVVIPNFPPKERKKRFTPMFAHYLSDVTVYEPFSRVFIVSTVGDYLFDSSSLISAS
jgi:hypothetical protein